LGLKRTFGYASFFSGVPSGHFSYMVGFLAVGAARSYIRYHNSHVHTTTADSVARIINKQTFCRYACKWFVYWLL